MRNTMQVCSVFIASLCFPSKNMLGSLCRMFTLKNRPQYFLPALERAVGCVMSNRKCAFCSCMVEIEKKIASIIAFKVLLLC